MRSRPWRPRRGSATRTTCGSRTSSTAAEASSRLRSCGASSEVRGPADGTSHSSDVATAAAWRRTRVRRRERALPLSFSFRSFDWDGLAAFDVDVGCAFAHLDRDAGRDADVEVRHRQQVAMALEMEDAVADVLTNGRLREQPARRARHLDVRVAAGGDADVARVAVDDDTVDVSRERPVRLVLAPDAVGRSERGGGGAGGDDDRRRTRDRNLQGLLHLSP